MKRRNTIQRISLFALEMFKQQNKLKALGCVLHFRFMVCNFKKLTQVAQFISHIWPSLTYILLWRFGVDKLTTWINFVIGVLFYERALFLLPPRLPHKMKKVVKSLSEMIIFLHYSISMMQVVVSKILSLQLQNVSQIQTSLTWLNFVMLIWFYVSAIFALITLTSKVTVKWSFWFVA